MGLRSWVRRLEQRSEGETVTLLCEECGEEFRVAEDTGPALVAYEWQEHTGAESYQPTPQDVFVLVGHKHDGSRAPLVKKATGESWPLTRRGSGAGAGIVGLTE
jgi:hypothetical protein